MKTIILAAALAASTIVLTAPIGTAWAGFVHGGNGFTPRGNGFTPRGNGWTGGKSKGSNRFIPPKPPNGRMCRIGTTLGMINGRPVKKPIYGPCR